MIKSFEEKSGINQDYYIVINKKDVISQSWLKKYDWFELNFSCWEEFYKKHKVKSSQIIWTHSIFGAPVLHQKTYKILVENLSRIHYIQA